MAQVQEKAAVLSKGIWASLFAFVPLVLEVSQQIAQSLPPSPKTSGVVAAIGGLLMLWTKLSPKQSQVTGLVAPKNEQVSKQDLYS